MAYEPQFSISPLLLNLVEVVAALRERIQSAMVELSWIPALQKDTRTRNVHASTAIEGNPLTLEQVRALEEGRELLASDERSQREVLNYFAGLRFVEKHASKKTIRHNEVFQLHKLLADGVMDQGESGRYRMLSVRVGAYPITLGRIEGHGRRGKSLTADYVLEYRNTKLATVEAKAWDLALTESVGQAKDYAKKLVICYTYATNGQRPCVCEPTEPEACPECGKHRCECPKEPCEVCGQLKCVCEKKRKIKSRVKLADGKARNIQHWKPSPPKASVMINSPKCSASSTLTRANCSTFTTVFNRNRR